LPLFISLKYPHKRIYSFESNIELSKTAERVLEPEDRQIVSTGNLEKLPALSTYVIIGDYQNEIFLDKMAKQASLLIFMNPISSTRKLLDLNFEITYRQNDILVYQKLT